VKILVIGGGGREHAIIWKLSQSKHIMKIYCSPGNAGIAEIAECIDVSPHNVDSLVDFVKYEWIDLTIVCSETFLRQGIVDIFERHGCKVLGLNREALSLGVSRVFSKNFMKRHRIPTAEYQVFSSYVLAQDYVQLKGVPLVIKTNGYPGDKGVFPVSTIDDAVGTLKRIMKDKTSGDAGIRVIIEEQLKGERISLITLADGRTIVPLASVCKYRGIPDYGACSDTTVFGSYSPVPALSKEIENDIMGKIMYPLQEALNAEGIEFRGFISADLVVQRNNIYIFELQFGFGDLEPQTVLPRLKSDIGELILSVTEERLSEVHMKWDEKMSVCVPLFSGKDPSEESTGSKIKGLDTIKKMEDVFLFQGSTVFDNNDIIIPGGNALYITATGKSLEEAKTRAYSAAGKIHFDGMQYSKDIGNNTSEGRESI
jgi:phosphoribosylamine---glycine ligase